MYFILKPTCHMGDFIPNNDLIFFVLATVYLFSINFSGRDKHRNRVGIKSFITLALSKSIFLFHIYRDLYIFICDCLIALEHIHV